MRIRVQAAHCSEDLTRAAPFAVSTPAAANNPPERVLIIDSFGRYIAPFNVVSAAFRTTLVRELAEPVDIDEAPFDTGRFAEPKQEALFVDCGVKKNSKWRAKRVTAATEGRRSLRWVGVAVVTLAVAGGLLYFSYRNPHPGSFDLAQDRPLLKAEGNTGAPATAQYVGSNACASCHAKETVEWRKSQHHDAMAAASEQSVLGNFNNAKFTYARITSTFFKRENKYYVRTDGRDGKLADFEIKYTFGVYPLQQYLLEFPDGRLQALSIVWDARPKQEGGQRWYHLYPNEKITYDDELHWTRPAQNWNFMCADCHSTDVRKNYDPVADRFQTRWAEISVGCEACHGPGSRHLAWAKSKEIGKSAAEDGAKGLSARLDERRDVTWAVNPTSGNAMRSQPRATEREVEVCAQCHARRGQMLMANSAARFTTGARSSKARCTRAASLAATATTPTAESCAPRAMPSAPPVTCQVSTTRQRTTTTNLPARAPHV